VIGGALEISEPRGFKQVSEHARILQDEYLGWRKQPAKVDVA
jgi:hypothetical protein